MDGILNLVWFLCVGLFVLGAAAFMLMVLIGVLCVCCRSRGGEPDESIDDDHVFVDNYSCGLPLPMQIAIQSTCM